ncbi:hypothetical protein C448_14575 [Halococcus morrhuae DSM 1307]|uniref:Glycosyltransferase RgtA/B/C/D-like domain-containing protein n=2 Tax=Halococcus morrhuae TaxID=2250 RepID=M0M5K1_HALMO|nr:hypothetical protein C448_14575 [Halococcus morrhuae DSM 1307]
MWLSILLVAFVVGVIATTHLFSPWIGVIALTLGVSLFGLRQYWRGNLLLALLAAGYLLRLAIIVLNSQLGVLTQPDISVFHHERSAALAGGWLEGQFTVPLSELAPARDTSLMRTVVAYLHAPFYVLLGSWRVAGELGTAFYGTIIGYMTYIVSTQITTRRNSIFAAGAVVFWPSIVYRSVVIQREVLVALAMLMMVWISLRFTQPNQLYERAPEDDVWQITHWTKRLPMGDIVLLFVAMVVLYVMRPENLAVAGVTLVVAFTLRNRHVPWRFVVVGGLLLPILGYFALNFGDFVGGQTALTPAGLDGYAHARAHGGSTYLADLHYRSWLDILLYAPVKVVYFLFSPLPWDVNGFTNFLAGVSGWALFIATAFTGRGFTMLRDHSEKRAIIATYAVSGILAYSIIEMNAGAAFRRRIQFVPVILILAAIALSSISFHDRSATAEMDAVSPSDSENSITTAEN